MRGKGGVCSRATAVGSQAGRCACWWLVAVVLVAVAWTVEVEAKGKISSVPSSSSGSYYNNYNNYHNFNNNYNKNYYNNNNNNNNSGKKKKASPGAIGGAIGLIVACILGYIAFYYIRKNQATRLVDKVVANRRKRVGLCDEEGIYIPPSGKFPKPPPSGLWRGTGYDDVSIHSCSTSTYTFRFVEGSRRRFYGTGVDSDGSFEVKDGFYNLDNGKFSWSEVSTTYKDGLYTKLVVDCITLDPLPVVQTMPDGTPTTDGMGGFVLPKVEWKASTGVSGQMSIKFDGPPAGESVANPCGVPVKPPPPQESGAKAPRQAPSKFKKATGKLQIMRALTLPSSAAKQNVPVALPDGWEAQLDPESGKTFYVDHINKTTSWTPPPPPAPTYEQAVEMKTVVVKPS